MDLSPVESGELRFIHRCSLESLEYSWSCTHNARLLVQEFTVMQVFVWMWDYETDSALGDSTDEDKGWQTRGSGVTQEWGCQ